MELNRSKNLKIFKKEIGQANHFFITILVGLNGIKSGEIEKEDSFRTSWNPKNKIISAERSKGFAKKSTLAWVVDNLDMYLRKCNEEPKLITDPRLESDFNGNNRSVYKNFLSIKDYLLICNLNSAMVDLLICWRNRLVHYKAKNDIQDESRKILNDNKEIIKKKHRGLNIEDTLKSFDGNETMPTFKEVTSLIKATIDFVYEIDEKLIKRLDIIKYADIILLQYIKNDKTKRLNNIFSNSKDKREKCIKNILREYGIAFEKKSKTLDYIENIIKLEFSEIKKQYEDGTFIY